MDLTHEPFEVAMARLERESAMLIKPSKVLNAAADLLEKGWCQGTLGQKIRTVPEYGALTFTHVNTEDFQPGVEIDRVCLAGAILKAAVDLTGTGYPPMEQEYRDDTPEQKAMKTSYVNAERAVAAGLKHAVPRLTFPSGVAGWNDCKGRQQSEVVGLVRATAILEEAAGR